MGNNLIGTGYRIQKAILHTLRYPVCSLRFAPCSLRYALCPLPFTLKRNKENNHDTIKSDLQVRSVRQYR